MGHNSGGRPERMRIATLTARDEAARDAAGPRHRREVVCRARRRQAPAVLADPGGRIPGSPAVAATVLSRLPAAARDRSPQDRSAPRLPDHGAPRRAGVRDHVLRRRPSAAVAGPRARAVRPRQADRGGRALVLMASAGFRNRVLVPALFWRAISAHEGEIVGPFA